MLGRVGGGGGGWRGPNREPGQRGSICVYMDINEEYMCVHHIYTYIYIQNYLYTCMVYVSNMRRPMHALYSRPMVNHKPR